MSGRPTTAIVLAGGLGTRLKSVVSELPKPMAPIQGRPFLEYLLDYWIAQGICHFILSVGYRHEVITAHFGIHYRGAQIDYAIEATPLGTGGGLLLAAIKIKDDEPFLILNGDTYFAVQLAALTTFFDATRADWAFSLFRTTDTARYMGMEVAPDGCITALQASVPVASSHYANGGVYMVRPQALSALSLEVGGKHALEQEMFPRALVAGHRFFGLEFSGTFIDIGVPHDYARAGELINAP